MNFIKPLSINNFSCKKDPSINFARVLIDTHCHIDITESFGISLNEIQENCIKNHIVGLIQIATDLNSSHWNIQFIKEYYKKEISKDLKIFYTIGLHPESIKEDLKTSEIITLIREKHKDPYFVGIGETGLDFYQSPATKEKQIESFYEHLKIAKEFQLPAIIHCRDDKQYNEKKLEAINLIYSIGKEINYEKAIMHCYTYSYKEAKQLLNLGWFFSFSGILTFKNATFIQEAAIKIPLEHILIETDAPFLAPVPLRGETNQPAYVKYVFEFLKNLLEINEIKLLNQLKENTLKIFNKIKI